VIGAVAATIGIVSGFFGGVIASVFMETYLQRRAQEEVGDYDKVSD
jgi:hypothetical protein